MTSGRTTGRSSVRRQLADATRRAESLRSVIESISGELALEPLLARIVDSAVALLGAGHGAIGLRIETPNGPAVRIAAVSNLPAASVDAVRPLDVGLAGRVVRENRTVRLDRYGDLERPVRPDIAGDAVIGVPIAWGERAIGFFGVGAPPPRRFSDDDVANLALFAKHAAIAIENARLFAAERRRAARIATINRLGRLLSSSDTLRDLLQRGVEAIRDDLGLTDLSIALVDPDDPEMLVLGANSRDQPVPVPPTFRQSIHAGVVGAAVRARRPVLVNDVASDPRYIRGPSPADVGAELAVPVIIGERLLGVFNVESTRPLTEEDAADLEVVAHQFGVAIEAKRLLDAERRRAARVATINRIGGLLTSSFSLDQIFQTAVEAINEHLDFANVAIMLVDPDEPEYLVLRARGGMYGSMVGEYRQHISQGIVGAAARSLWRVLVNNVREDPRYIAIPGGEHIVAELAAPILVGGRLRGMLNIESEQRIAEDDADGLAIVADQMSTAIENARLFAETQAALEETRLMYETSRRIGVAMDSDEVVRAYLEQVAARGHYACTVVQYEADETGERSVVRVRGRWTPDEGMCEGGDRIARTHDQLDPLLDAGQTVTITDVYSDRRVSDSLRQLQAESGRPALAMIPLMVRGDRIGLVILASPVVHAWSGADLRPYQVTAAQLAAAIDSRRQQLLVSERGRQLAVLEERGRLARELHDSVTQSVFTVTLIAQSLGSAWRRDPAEGERRVDRLLDLSQSALAELRALLAELRPADSDSPPPEMRVAIPSSARVRRDGLVAALGEHVAGVARDGLQLRFESERYVPQPAEQEEALFRIAQEALNNVTKHARATRATVRLSTDAGWVRLTVSDDGAGFGETAGPDGVPFPSRTGLGLIGMRERAAALGGAAQVLSTPGRGTTVDAILPRKDGTAR